MQRCVAMLWGSNRQRSCLLTKMRDPSWLEEFVGAVSVRFILTLLILFCKISNPCREWLPDQSWGAICRLTTLPAFQRLDEDLISNEEWVHFFQSGGVVAASVSLPGPWQQKWNAFRKMMVLLCLFPANILDILRWFLTQHVGPKTLTAPPYTMESVYQVASSSVPVLLLCSSGDHCMCV